MPELILDNYAPDYHAILNKPELWMVNMPMPESYNRDRVRRYQELIDRLVGVSNDQPIIKLAWMPECFEWYPHPIGTEPIGYTCPTWPALWDKDGKIVAAPRWGLMERCEPAQYMPGWQESRYTRRGGQTYDAAGPAPANGYYTPRKRHIVHRDGCCLRSGNEENCWGYYVEPNEELLQWIGEHAYISRSDNEIQPHTPVEHLPRFRSQSRVESRMKDDIIPDDIDIPSPIIQPGSVFRQAPSGLYLPNGD